MEEPLSEQPAKPVRPTKKQRELLEYIQTFIVEHGYGPSYREIMVGCNYTSVATVAVHIKNLIARGHLRKNGRSARSLEVVGAESLTKPLNLPTNALNQAEEKWLIEKIEYVFKQAEEGAEVTPGQIEDLQILLQALNVLNLEGAAVSLNPRLVSLKNRLI